MDQTPAFALADTHKEFRRAVRQMCEDRIAPHAAEVDRNAAFPWDGFKASVEMELPTLGIPVAYGGAGADHVTQAIMVEELARVCASTSVTMLISKLAMLRAKETLVRESYAKAGMAFQPLPPIAAP